MRLAWLLVTALVIAIPGVDAQTRRTTKKAPARAARKAPEPDPVRIQAVWKCPTELGKGVATGRVFCDILTGSDPKEGVLVTIPPHRGTVTISFDLHNRHTYSADLVKSKQAYRKHTATIGVLEMDNTLVERAVVQSEFRTEKDLFDRITGGAGPGGVKAVAPIGNEMIVMELPETVGEEVSFLGEKLSVLRPGGEDHFSSPGVPIAIISNVMLEFRPAPPPKKPAPKKP
jgi:hypothetical protein